MEGRERGETRKRENVLEDKPKSSFFLSTCFMKF